MFERRLGNSGRPDYVPQARDVEAEILPLCREFDVALAWLFAQGNDIIPIPGTKQLKYLEQNVAALDLALAQSALDLLAATFNPGARAGDRYAPGVFEMLGA